VTSSVRLVLAMWENYKALMQHFEEAKYDSTREKKINSHMKVCSEKLHLENYFSGHRIDA
jgi:hypothetical protein